MTDKYNYLTVALEDDIRSDDAETIIAAIGMIRGVLKVEPNVANGTDWTAQQRIRREIGTRVWEVLFPETP
jgi:hypothetical protein